MPASGVGASGAGLVALVWGSLDRRPRGAASSGRHWSGPGVASTGVYRPWSDVWTLGEAAKVVGSQFCQHPELFFSRLAMKWSYAYGVRYVRYLEIAWIIQKWHASMSLLCIHTRSKARVQV